MYSPILFPIGIMALFAPKVNNDIPITKNNAPTKKSDIILVVNGVIVKCKNSTNTKIGKIDIFELATTVAKATKIAKATDQIIVTTGTTDTLNNVMKVCEVD